MAQWVPVEWLANEGTALLFDNVLHQAPYPTIHLIRREDLDSVRRCYTDVASLLERNSRYIREVPALVLRKAFQAFCPSFGPEMFRWPLLALNRVDFEFPSNFL